MLSSTKKVDYQGWASDWGFGSLASLTDDAGNSYKQCGFGLTTIVGQVDDGESIYPKKTLGDCLVFELPTETCQTLFLNLPAKTFGGTGSLRMKIPRSLWDDKARRQQEAAQYAETKLKEADRLQNEMKAKKKAVEKLRWRTWASTTGKFSVRAKYLGWAGDEVYEEQRKALWEKYEAEENDEKKKVGKRTLDEQLEPFRRYREAMKSLDPHVAVRLQKEDGKILNVTKDRLSGEDQAWIEEFDQLLDDVNRLPNWSLEKIVRTRYKHIEYDEEETDE